MEEFPVGGLNKSMKKISFGQMMVILFISRIFYSMTFIPFKYNDVTCQVIGFSIATAIECLAVIPLIILYKKHPDKNICQVAYEKSKFLGILICIAFAFAAVLVINRLFRYFGYFMYLTFPDFLPLWLVIGAVAIVSFYAAFQGIEAIARSAGIAFAFFILSFVIVAAALITKMSFSNVIYTYPKFSNIWHEIYYELSRFSELLLFPILYPYVKEKAGKSIYGAIALKLIFVYLIITVCVLTLGSYLNISKFPFFDLGAYAETFIIERLDAFLLPAWILVAFVKTALFMFVAKIALATGFKRVKSNVLLLIVSVAALAVSLAAVLQEKWSFNVWDKGVLSILIIGLGVLLPIAYCFGKGDENE